MAPLHLSKFLLLLVLFALLLVPPSSSLPSFVARRHLLDLEKKNRVPVEQKPSLNKNKSGTNTLITPTLGLSKNNTKLIKPKSTSTTASSSTNLQHKSNLNKLSNSTSKPPLLKLSNSTKPTSKTTNSTELLSKTTNSTKLLSKTTNSTKPTSKTTKTASLLSQKSTDPIKPTPTDKKSTKPVSRLTYREEDEDDEDDFVSEFRDLPSRFQETFIPDLQVLSTTSKAYLNKANKQISQGFKPIVGKKYASMVASVISFAFILIPFLLVSLIFNRIKAYFSLQKLIIFIQIYLSIYFSILSLSSLVSGLEPLKFFYATSQSTYICIQLLQTLAYVLYLVVLLMYLVLVFSTAESSIVSKLLGLGQTFVGLAVGLHYYMTVFHRVVLRQPPKTSWKVHAVYATCFLLICLLGTAERRKKAYLVDGTEDSKNS